MKPAAWSHSRLDSFKNCPRAFYEKSVAKSVVEEKGEATKWGEEVHKHFEDRLQDGVVLPPVLEVHEPYLAKLESLPGQGYVEHRIAFDTHAAPCEFFGDDVWFRGVIDYLKVNGAHALVIDHKTGKFHQKFQQLSLFALWVFAAFPKVQTVRAEYYWTQTRTHNGNTYHREYAQQLWTPLVPDLKQYAQAFKEDVWQPRQSGLCKRHCPVKDCEFNGLSRGRY